MPYDRTDILFLIEDIFVRRGHESYLGEQVTMAEHMLQAAWWAEDAGAEDALVVAALLHDIGHFTGEFGAYSTDDTEDRYHDKVGGQVLEPHFPTLVSECVRLHVAAKRYLCTTEPAYYEQLSETSVHTLGLQGGPMSRAEILAFEANPHYQSAVLVRKWDDRAKVPGSVTKTIQDYLPMLEKILISQSI